MGAGALAALALPTPLMELLPGSAPKKALASNQNISDGIYAFRYFSDKGYSLDLPDMNPNPVSTVVYTSHNSANQYWVVAYDSDCDGYRISPVCGHTPGMVLTATAGSGNDVRTAKDQALSTQRWMFKQNSNGAWIILSMADPTLAVNLWTGIPSKGGSVKMYRDNGRAANDWALDCLAPSVKTNLNYVGDLNKVYPVQTKISSGQKSNIQILEMPSSGWSVEYSAAGNPKQLNASDYLSSPAKFSFMYDSALVINDELADIQVAVTIPTQSLNSENRVKIYLGWRTQQGSLFEGICVENADKWTVAYSAFDHESGEKISLKGAWMTVFSISGASCGDPSNAYAYTREYGFRPNYPHEGVAYLQQTGTVEAYVMQDNRLCYFCDGVWFGRDPTPLSMDYIGSPESEYNSVALLCADDSPTFQHFCMGYNNTGSNMRAWFFPMFSPLGITEPDAPEKSAKLTG